MTAESAEPYREFISQMVLRLEHAGRAVNRELAGMREELVGIRGDVRGLAIGQQESFRLLGEEISDLRDDVRAHTQALLRLLDRLGEGEEPAT